MKKGKKDEDNPHFPTFFTYYYCAFSFLPFLVFYLFTFPFISYLNPIFRLKLSGFSL